MLINAKQIQKYLQTIGLYKGRIDGIIGPKSMKAVDAAIAMFGMTNGITGLLSVATWDRERKIIAVVQLIFKALKLYSGAIDGKVGPMTRFALEMYQNFMRDNNPYPVQENTPNTQFPTYDEAADFYGPVGSDIGRFKLPYTMRLAWDTETTITHISLHKKCGESAIGVLEHSRDYYGTVTMTELGLDLFGGSLNVRPMRGGTRPSLHSWAAAIDFDPENNQLRWDSTKATLDAKVYDKWWSFWEAEGWVSLGRERNYDWMHVQACRLN